MGGGRPTILVGSIEEFISDVGYDKLRTHGVDVKMSE